MFIKAFSVVALALILPTISSASVINTQTDHQNRIANGKQAKLGDFPYQISIKSSSNMQHNCGGSILNKKWILTAAHCVNGTKPDDWTILVGTVSLRSGGTLYSVSKIIVHENYICVDCLFNLRKLSNDLALIKIKGEIDLSSKFIRSIELEPKRVVKDNVNCVVSGWGMLSDESRPDKLQYLHTTTMSNTECRKYTKKLTPPADVDQDQICSIIKRARYMRKGDSGGPLVVDGKQIGVVSWAPLYADQTKIYAGVYTRVSSYIDWIKNNTRD